MNRAAKLPLVLAVAGGLSLSIALAAVVVAKAAIGVAVISVIALAAVLTRIHPRYLIAAFLVYLPFEGFVLKYVPASDVAFVRYGPEILFDFVAIVLLLVKVDLVAAKLRWVGGVLVAVMAAWIGTAIINGVSVSTTLIGLRGEFRFLPLMVLPLVSQTLRADLRLWGRVLVIGGVIQSIIVYMEWLGGTSVRAFFSPQYSIVINGIAVASSGAPRLDTVFGTFGNYNALGIFLVLAWAVLAAAGASELGFSRRRAVTAALLIVAAVILSGSRESLVVFLLIAVIVGRARYRLPLKLVGVVTVVAVVVLVFAAPQQAQALQPGSRVVSRWEALLNPSQWHANYQGNFRLFFLTSQLSLVRQQSPIWGFGLGTVQDRRTLSSGTSPLYRSFAGQRAASFSYLYDGNWALILLETGFLGLGALGGLVVVLAVAGIRAAQRHWCGLALFATISATVVLGFFAPVLQLRHVGAILWLLAGATVAVLREEDRYPVSS